MTSREGAPAADEPAGRSAERPPADEHIVIDLRPLERSGDGFIPPSGGLLAASEFQLAVKRLVDIIGASVALVLLMPLFLICALAIKLTSAGPTLYPQTRVGKDGREFTFYKFRSMHIDAHRQRDELAHLNETDGPVFKMREDPRITPVGRILRRTSIDEAPQFWNVLKGDMSLVGPRPPLPSEVLHYDGRQWQRLMVWPGLTCIWQVSGRSDLDFATWVEMDLEYIRRWTPWLDIVLLLRTIPAVLSGRGAY